MRFFGFSDLRSGFVFCLLAFAAFFACGACPAAASEADVSIVRRVPVRLAVNGAERPIELRGLDITSDITGRFALTTVEMTFFNPNSRILEGELQFPLEDGQTVTGFALSMGEGKKEVMREAVPVDKAKGRQTFEAIERQNIDPALLEVTQGNNFKLRVYPLEPGKTRRVRVTYAEALPDGDSGLTYRLPLSYADKIARLDINIRAETADAPSVKGITIGGAELKAARVAEGTYSLTLSAEDVSSGADSIAISLAPSENGAFIGRKGDTTYFYAETPGVSLDKNKNIALYPKSLSILWDASASGGKRDHSRETAFLGAFFAAASDVTVDLQRVRDIADSPLKYEIKDGDWSALKKELESTIYDGATNLGAFDTKTPSGAFFLFSDGLDNYSASPFVKPAKPLYAFISSPSNDAPRLKFMASDGDVVDLRTFGVNADAIAGLFGSRSRIISAEGSGVSDVVWTGDGRGGFRLAGIVKGDGSKITVTLETPSGESVKREIALDAAPGESGSGSVPYMWASMKLEALDGEYSLNRGEIRRLGRAFGIPTRETSLIVLDSAADYARYDIDPPSELRAEYDKIRASMASSRGESDKLARVVSEWKSRIEWWETDFPKGPMPKPKKTSEIYESEYDGEQAVEMEREMRRESPMMAATPAPMAMESLVAGRAPNGVNDESKAVQPQAEGSVIKIAMRPWSPDEPYTRRMKEARDEDLYRVYLDERPDYENSAAFFLDVSYQLRDRGLEELSNRVLSNLAEMNLENRAILRVLGYRLLEAGKPEQAVVIFKQVLALADDEQQSYRDLGLALGAAGEHQAAVDNLYEVVARNFERSFPGIEVITLTEMNAIIAASKEKLDTSRIDPRLIGNYPLDLRVILTWDTDNTDIDLHVIDPNAQEAFYEAPLSYQGGKVSPDNTAGYGPEEYSLKKAKPGLYRIKVNFYGHSQQIISEATTIQLDFFTKYGAAGQQKQSITMRLKDAKDNIFVGEFEVKE